MARWESTPTAEPWRPPRRGAISKRPEGWRAFGFGYYREQGGGSCKTFATIRGTILPFMDPRLSPWVGLLAPDRKDRKWGLPHTVQHSHGDSNPKARTDNCGYGRSLLAGPWLLTPEMHLRQSVHPLLLDPTYWRNCLQGLNLGQHDLLFRERNDLSNRRAKVAEFQLCSHDGTPLKGLCSRPVWVPGRRPFRVRSVSCKGPLELDTATLKQGVADFVFQGPEGRPLKDRVLDVVAVVHMAQQMPGIDAKRTNLGDHDVSRANDEFVITEHLLAWDLIASLP